MKSRDIVLVGVFALFVVVYMRKKNPFAVLEASNTATAKNIPNVIPPHLHDNARGLLVIYNHIMSKPGAWTSSRYRGALLNAAIVPAGHPNSHHTKARALDFGGWTEDEIVNDSILGLGITNKRHYPNENPPRWHMSWDADYLRMLTS